MNLKNRLPIFETVLVTVILVVHAYAALSDAYNLPNAWFSRDDAYYYFKVAQNISEGRGSTFDGINPTNGYHPLWMLVNIPIFSLARFDLILPLRVLLMVMAVLNAATAVLIYRLVRRVLSLPTAMLAASFWAFNGHIHYTVYEFGLETPLAAFAVVWLMDQLSIFETQWHGGAVRIKRIILLAVIATLVMFSRLDLVFLAVVVGVWILFRGHPIRFLLPLDMLVIFFSMVSAFAWRTGFPAYYLYMDAVLVAVALGLIVKVPALYFFGAYQHPRPTSLIKALAKTAAAVSASGIILAAVLFLLNSLNIIQGFPRAALLLDWGISLVLLSILRLAGWWFGKRSADFNLQSPMLELKANWKAWLTEGGIYYGILGGSLTLYMLWNKMAFGTSTPVSGQIKRWWGSMLESVYGAPAIKWQNFLGLGLGNEFEIWRPASFYIERLSERMRPVMPGSDRVDERFLAALGLTCLAAMLILIFNRRRALLAAAKLGLIPLIAGSGIHILSYTATEYAGMKEWYWISQVVLLILTAGLLLELFLRPIAKNNLGRAMVTFASVVLCFYLAIDLGESIRAKMPHSDFPADRPYMEILPAIEEATPPGSVIGMTGGGNVGYFIHDRTIVNMDGLINSYDYFRALQDGEAAVYLKQNGMDIVFANPGLLELAPYRGQFAPYLEKYADFYGKSFLYLLDQPKY